MLANRQRASYTRIELEAGGRSESETRGRTRHERRESASEGLNRLCRELTKWGEK